MGRAMSVDALVSLLSFLAVLGLWVVLPTKAPRGK
jgi:hypothetical protein